MKNILLLGLLCASFCSCQRNKVNESDIAKDNLKGDVWGIIKVGYKAVEKFGEPTKGELQSDFSDLNFVKTYNKEGNTLENISLYGFEKFVIYKNFYDESGKRDYIDANNPDGTLNSKFKNEYDSDGKLKYTKTYDSNGKLTSTEESIYNDLKQLVKEETSYPTNESPVNPYSTIYEYQGDSIKTVSLIGSDGKVFEYEKFRDNKKIESKKDPYISEFQYNENDDISIEKVNDSHSKIIITYKYKYDGRGNWIELVKYGSPDIPNYNILHPLSIYYRTIFYGPNTNNLTAEEILNNSVYKSEYESEQIKKLQEKYCNEAFVKEQILNYFSNNLPDWTVLKNRLKISSFGECKFNIYSILQNNEYSSIKKQVSFVFTYKDDYSGFTVSDVKESNY